MCDTNISSLISMCNNVTLYWHHWCHLDKSSIYMLSLEIQLWRGVCWDPIYLFNSATLLCLSQARNWISNVICRGLFLCSMRSVKMRGDCPFCWYWWNWWPSLLNFLFIWLLIHFALNILLISYQVSVKSIFAQQINHSIYLSTHTTAGEGTCILVTDLGLMLLASWHSNTPSFNVSGKLSGKVTFNLLSIVCKIQFQ